MSVKLSTILAAGKKTSDAKWVEFSSGLMMLVKPMGHKGYESYIRSNSGFNRETIRAKRAGLDMEKVNDLTMKAVAHEILVGWKGLVDDEDNVIEYTPEKAYELFQGNDVFYNEILEISQRLKLDSLAFEDESLGN